MAKNIEVELIGMPSGQVLTVNTIFIQILYNYNLIRFDKKLGWAFLDADEEEIKEILNKKDINVF